MRRYSYYYVQLFLVYQLNEDIVWGVEVYITVASYNLALYPGSNYAGEGERA